MFALHKATSYGCSTVKSHRAHCVVRCRMQRMSAMSPQHFRWLPDVGFGPGAKFDNPDYMNQSLIRIHGVAFGTSAEPARQNSSHFLKRIEASLRHAFHSMKKTKHPFQRTIWPIYMISCARPNDRMRRSSTSRSAMRFILSMAFKGIPLSSLNSDPLRDGRTGVSRRQPCL